MTSYGLDPKPKANTPAFKAKAQLQSMLRDAVTAKENLTGKKLDDVAVQGELDRILSTSKTTPGSWWGLVSGPFFDKTTRITDVPLTEQALIKEALHHAGQPVDDATVLSIYLTRSRRRRSRWTPTSTTTHSTKSRQRRPSRCPRSLRLCARRIRTTASSPRGPCRLPCPRPGRRTSTTGSWPTRSPRASSRFGRPWRRPATRRPIVPRKSRS